MVNAALTARPPLPFGAARVYISARKTAQIEEAVADFETRYPGKVIGLPVPIWVLIAVAASAMTFAFTLATVGARSAAPISKR